LTRRAFLPVVLLAASSLRADFAAPPAPEPDEIFRQGVDALDRGDAARADAEFSSLAEKYPLPAWKARIEFVRAHQAFDHGSASDAVAAFSALDVRSIGMQGYRDYFLGIALERIQRPGDARQAYRRASDEEGGMADRVSAALALGRLSRSRAEKSEALTRLENATAYASPEQRKDLIQARARLAADLGNDDALARAASEMLAIDPGLLFDRNLPRTLSREARREMQDLTDSQKLALAERLYDGGQTTAALTTTQEISNDSLPPPEKRRLHLLRARTFERLGKIDASDREAKLVGAGAPEENAAALVTAENLQRRALTHRGRGRKNLSPRDLPAAAARRLALAFHLATADAGSPDTRMRGFRSEIALWVAAGDIPSALDAARRMTALDAGATWGFEALWKTAWDKIAAKDFSGGLDDIVALASIYHEVSASRRLQYWSARCFERLGKNDSASELGHELACADPADLYARFAAAWKTECSTPVPSEPPEASGVYAHTDELLRLRLYPEARREADRLPEGRGKKLRVAVAAFALGDFSSATASVKAAFAEIGTALEGEVPDQWRRLYYPLASGGIVEAAAREFGIDPSLFRGVVRQESAFNARAKSKAGAAGLTQLMPGTARLLSRKVLRKRFRTAFLYDPAMNVRLGASYLRQLLDRFGGDPLMALAAYNAGPGRIGGFLRDHPELSADERIESLPAPETRDYVRRVFLFSESYRELYPETATRK
jgi:soluble lytic murein transglycosylase-like protein